MLDAGVASSQPWGGFGLVFTLVSVRLSVRATPRGFLFKFSVEARIKKARVSG